MKFCTLLIMTILSCLISAAQVKIIPVVDTSVYIGIDNYLSLKSSTIPLNKLTVRANACLVSGSNGNYIIRCSSWMPSLLIEVLYKNKVVSSKKININWISDSIVYAVGDSIFNAGKITKNQLHSLRSLVVKINYPLAKFMVTKFTVQIIHLEKSKGIIENNSFTLSSDVSLYLKYAEVGDQVIFDNIMFVSPDSRGRELNPVVLKVIQ